MARAKIAHAILVLLLSVPGPHRAWTKGFMNEAAPSSSLNSLHGQRTLWVEAVLRMCVVILKQTH